MTRVGEEKKKRRRVVPMGIAMPLMNLIKLWQRVIHVLGNHSATNESIDA